LTQFTGIKKIINVLDKKMAKAIQAFLLD